MNALTSGKSASAPAVPLHRMKVAKIADFPGNNAGWDAPPWNDVMPAAIERAMGGKPPGAPSVSVKVVHDDSALYVIFRCMDSHVRSVVTEYQGSVCADSCVEFFFAPGPGIADGYFNLEINAGGTALFCHQKARGVNVRPVPACDFAAIRISHSLPDVVDPELNVQTEWFVEFRLPMAVVEKHAPSFARPAPGTVWRANFYKCGDRTSLPHWLTWAPVDLPYADFHRPEFFGELVFG